MAVEFKELTHHGRGAISVIGVRGEGSQQCIGSSFTSASGRALSELTKRPIIYGTWNSTGEDLIVVRRDQNSFEIQCHGSIAAVEAIKSDLSSTGATESPELADWTMAADPLQAEVALSIESCITHRTARHMLRQFHLWGTVDEIDSEVASTALSFAKFGQKLTQPWKVVLCGQPNVGKSSMINALCGFERAIVHPTAGTTRDLVSQHTAIDGWPVEMIDSAGIRDAGNEIEQAGISKARDVIELADLVIHVVDASKGSEYDPEVSQHRAGIVVINKVDLCDEPTIPQTALPSVALSAKTHQGLDQLQESISRALVPVVPDNDQLVPVTAAQVEHLNSRL